MEQWTKAEFYQRLHSGESGALYLFTPMCGTCQVASKMLSVVEEILPKFEFGKADLNYLPEIAEEFLVESVPCLLIYEDKKVKEKIYAFQSVLYLYEKLKN
ncbi:thioredoxin family protein [Caldibacillus lycopersici]|uniref:Thioredoxin family protein n=1 Tax=Perspicuibacillus lycopersici TaxID=1325689 RepID=A0AAE3IQS4_9BACI|nr:thioredoxin family protein [Perspicuibacillus lycopersici]MCU9612848.1 thioredoxin family protein [Perspicuibacillus lycopersici]